VALGQAFLVPAVVLVRTAQETDAVAFDPLLMDHRALSPCALALESEHIKPNAALVFCGAPGKPDLDPHLGVLPRLETAQFLDPAPPRSATALCMPPSELSVTVRRKRNTSRKLDLPEAFGPMRYVVSASAASTLRKFSQFLRRTWSIRMVLIVLNRLRRRLDQS